MIEFEPSLYSGSMRVIAANNDAQVRTFDAENFACLNCFSYDWSVNVSIVLYIRVVMVGS